MTRCHRPSRGERCRASRSLLALQIGLLSLVVGCAGGLPAEDGRFVMAEDGVDLAAPEGEGALWERVRVRGTLLAFRGRAGTEAERANLSLLRRCRERQPEVRILARQLLIGLREREFVRDERVELAGAPGWLQALDAREEERAVHLETVTRLDGQCALDFLLVAPEARPALSAEFESWWGSLEVREGLPG